MYSIGSIGTIFLYSQVLYMSWPPNSLGARMQTSDISPSRKSMLATGHVKPSGPHHCFTISGSTHAFQTVLSGASKPRVNDEIALFWGQSWFIFFHTLASKSLCQVSSFEALPS